MHLWESTTESFTRRQSQDIVCVGLLLTQTSIYIWTALSTLRSVNDTLYNLSKARHLSFRRWVLTGRHSNDPRVNAIILSNNSVGFTDGIHQYPHAHNQSVSPFPHLLFWDTIMITILQALEILSEIILQALEIFSKTILQAPDTL